MEMFWEKSNWENQDPDLTRLKSMPFQRDFKALSLEKGLYVIRGPRQIGKSCWLKTLLSQVAQKQHPRDCFYYSCEEVEDFKHLSEILKSQKDKKYIFFDEITYVDEWWRPVKRAIDSGQIHTLVVTGSNAMDLRNGADLMPGRYGSGEDLYLLPMGFEEFSLMRKKAGWPELPRIDELELYFKVGGFPTAVAEAGAKGQEPKLAKEIYLKWLLGDILKAGKQPQFLKEILAQIALTMTTPLSLQKLASRTQMATHNTAQDYVQILEDCFALKTLYAIDPNTSAFHFKKGKKFYFTDPLIYWIALEWGGFRAPEGAMAHLAEMVCHQELSKKYKRFGYYSTNKGEIDFYSPQNWALEVKWSQVPTNLSHSYKNSPLTQKICWSQNNFLKEWPKE